GARAPARAPGPARRGDRRRRRAPGGLARIGPDLPERAPALPACRPTRSSGPDRPRERRPGPLHRRAAPIVGPRGRGGAMTDRVPDAREVDRIEALATVLEPEAVDAWLARCVPGSTWSARIRMAAVTATILARSPLGTFDERVCSCLRLKLS